MAHNYKGLDIRAQKYVKNNGWNAVEDLETDHERKKQKLWSKKQVWKGRSSYIFWFSI